MLEQSVTIEYPKLVIWRVIAIQAFANLIGFYMVYMPIMLGFVMAVSNQSRFKADMLILIATLLLWLGINYLAFYSNQKQFNVYKDHKNQKYFNMIVCISGILISFCMCSYVILKNF
ncbi:hypothetical protein [Paenibacillus kyungheensis]